MGTFGTPSSYNNTGALGGATNPTTAQGLSRDRENQKAILELPGTQAWVEKTITDGVIIPTSAEVIVLPEGGASTDSLTTIALTSDGTTALHEGMLIRLKATNSDTITVVHGAGTNNISTIDGNNVVLDTTWYLELKMINGLWVQQETSAYITANEAKITAAAASTPATTTARGIGRVATLADMEPGAAVENGPAFLDAGTFKVTPTPTANAVPQADAGGHIETGWIGSMLCNVREVLTTSGTWTAPVTGWYKVICIGGGSGGSRGHVYIPSTGTGGAGGGGGSGYITTAFKHITAGSTLTCTVGAGGAGGTTNNGTDGGNTTFGTITAKGGSGSIWSRADYSSSRTHSGETGGIGGVSGGTGGSGGYSSVGGTGGCGGATGLGFGGGGGGGAGGGDAVVSNGLGGAATDGGTAGAIASTATGGNGGNGGNGAVILEYFNPAVTA